MDTSAKYIEQCWKAVKVQEIFKSKLHKNGWVGNYVSVKWKETTSMGGFDSVLLQESPSYGLSYNRGKWIAYNGQLPKSVHYTRDITEYIKDVIWLPKQDQLQDMINTNFMETQVTFYTFLMNRTIWKDVTLTFLIDRVNKYGGIFKSLGQLWLAFVMKEKFNKTWNGNDWI